MRKILIVMIATFNTFFMVALMCVTFNFGYSSIIQTFRFHFYGM
jgi:hypothetical protein